MGKDMGWLIGVGINLVGSILINLGTNVMKLGHNKRAAMDCPESAKPPISRFRAWQIGVAAFTIGNVANFLSFGYAAQSLLAAIGCVQFVSNVIFASVVLKEQVTKPIIIATGAIVGGCVLLVSFGSHTSRSYNMKDLLGLYNEPAYVAYLVVGGVAVVGCYLLYWRGRKAVSQAGGQASGVWAAALPILYSTFSAIIGTQSVLFSKTLAVLLRATFSGDNQLTKWFTYVVVPVFLCSAAFWVTRLNKGLRMFPAMVIVPTLQIAWTLFSIISGMLYFQEYRGMTALHAAMFALGVTIVFSGVFLLTKSTAKAGPSTAELAAAAAKAKLVYVTFEDEALESRRHTMDTIKALHSGEEEQNVDAATSTRSAAALSNNLQPGTEEQHLGVEDAAAEAAAAAAEAAGGKPTTTTPQSSSSRRAAMEQADAELEEAGQSGLLELGFSKERRRQLQRVVKSLQKRMRIDFDLDEGTAAKLMMGLGDEALPAISLFAPPMVDYHTAATAQLINYGALADRSFAGGSHPATSLSALPSFTHGDEVHLLPGHGQHSSSHTSHQHHPPMQLTPHQQPAAGSSSSQRGSGNSSTPTASQQQQQQRQQHLQLSGGVPRQSSSSGINPLSNAFDVKPVARPGSPIMDNLMTTVGMASRSLRENIRATLANVQQQTPHQLLHPGSHGRGKAYGRAGFQEDDDSDSTPMLGRQMEPSGGGN